jgi:hypothetical protein
MISNRDYVALSSTERPEVTVPMSHQEFREFATRFYPDYQDISNGTSYQLVRELLEQACLRIARLEGRVLGLSYVLDSYRSRLIVPSESGIWTTEEPHGPSNWSWTCRCDHCVEVQTAKNAELEEATP